MASGQAKLTFAVSKVFSACNEPWNYCMPSKMAADEKPKDQVPQAERARKWNLKHKVTFLISNHGQIHDEAHSREAQSLGVGHVSAGQRWRLRWAKNKKQNSSIFIFVLARWEQHGLNDDGEVLSCSQNELTQIVWLNQSWLCSSALLITIWIIRVRAFGAA